MGSSTEEENNQPLLNKDLIAWIGRENNLFQKYYSPEKAEI